MTMLLAAAGDLRLGGRFSVTVNPGIVCCVIRWMVLRYLSGNLGPALSDVGARLTEAQIRLRIVDNTKVNPGTVMPSYYRTSDLHQVGRAYQGETVLSAAEVEHLVAWLSQLTGRKE